MPMAQLPLCQQSGEAIAAFQNSAGRNQENANPTYTFGLFSPYLSIAVSRDLQGCWGIHYFGRRQGSEAISATDNFRILDFTLLRSIALRIGQRAWHSMQPCPCVRRNKAYIEPDGKAPANPARRRHRFYRRLWSEGALRFQDHRRRSGHAHREPHVQAPDVNFP